MNTRFMILLSVVLLSACGSSIEEAAAPKVSRVEPVAGGGMSYPEFREHEINDGDTFAAQKRFIILDRNNDGHLSPAEFNGY